jgi:hypothetical protein
MNPDRRPPINPTAADQNTPGAPWQRCLSLPGMFAIGVFVVFLFAFTFGSSKAFVHRWIGLWIDWGWWARRTWEVSLASTSATLLWTLAAFRRPRSERVRRGLVWNTVGFGLHLLILATCLGFLFLLRDFDPGPAT